MTPAAGRLVARSLLLPALAALATLTPAAAPPPAAAPALSPTYQAAPGAHEAADEALTASPSAVRLRKLHLVRPDLIQYPLSYDVFC